MGTVKTELTGKARKAVQDMMVPPLIAFGWSYGEALRVFDLAVLLSDRALDAAVPVAAMAEDAQERFQVALLGFQLLEERARHAHEALRGQLKSAGHIVRNQEHD